MRALTVRRKLQLGVFAIVLGILASSLFAMSSSVFSMLSGPNEEMSYLYGGCLPG